MGNIPVELCRAVIDDDIGHILSADLPWQRLDGCTVLVTGAGGMVASMLVEALAALPSRRDIDCRVVALVRNRRKAEARFAHLLAQNNFELLVQDVCAPLPAQMRPDYIIHAASPASPGECCRAPVDAILPNVIGTEHLLRSLCGRHAKGFLFLSSSEVYGAVDRGGQPIAEDCMGVLDPLQLRSCYGESKRQGENLCAAYTFQYGVRAACARLFHTYGPGMNLEDGRIFSSVVADVLRGSDIVLHSAGTVRRAFCYVSDAAVGLLLLLLRAEAGKAYNLGNQGEEYSMSELAGIVAGLRPGIRVVHRIPPESERTPGVLAERIIPDISSLRALGWQPTINVHDGFDKTLNAYGSKP